MVSIANFTHYTGLYPCEAVSLAYKNDTYRITPSSCFQTSCLFVCCAFWLDCLPFCPSYVDTTVSASPTSYTENRFPYQSPNKLCHMNLQSRCGVFSPCVLGQILVWTYMMSYINDASTLDYTAYGMSSASSSFINKIAYSATATSIYRRSIIGKLGVLSGTSKGSYDVSEWPSYTPDATQGSGMWQLDFGLAALGMCDPLLINASITAKPLTTNPCISVTKNDITSGIERWKLIAYTMATIKPCEAPCLNHMDGFTNIYNVYLAYKNSDSTANDQLANLNQWFRDNLFCTDWSVCTTLITDTDPCMTASTIKTLFKVCPNMQMIQNVLKNRAPAMNFNALVELIGRDPPDFMLSDWLYTNKVCTRLDLISSTITTCAALVDDGVGCLSGSKLNNFLLNNAACNGYVIPVTAIYGFTEHINFYTRTVGVGIDLTNLIQPYTYCKAKRSLGVPPTNAPLPTRLPQTSTF